MAAANYYGEYNPYNQVRHDGSTGSQPARREAPLPPEPTSSPQPRGPYSDTKKHISPVVTPLDDSIYTSHSQRSDYLFAETSYHGSQHSLIKAGGDPFADQHAIPLHTQRPKSDLRGSGEGLNGSNAFGSQPYTYGRDERRQSRRNRPPEPWYKQKRAWFVWIITSVQIVVFIVELVRNAMLTHSPIEIHPQFNPMIGPSPYVQINMGARYVPCMRNTHNVTDSKVKVFFQCPNTTTYEAKCQLSDLCGFGGVPNPDPNNADLDRKPEPNQWFRFIVPIFLHAGLIHIGFNMLLQVTMGREMELTIGSLRFALVYFSAGIFGFVFGGNFAAPGIASTGASGCLFGVLALTLLDLLYNWSSRPKPVVDLLFIVVDVLVSFVLGLLPGLDNFSHIGGFLMGLALGVCILHSPAPLRQRLHEDEHPHTPYSAVPGSADLQYDATAVKAFARQPVGFFKGRKTLWWIWWIFRAAALVGIIVVFIILLRNFYVNRTQCGWCKHLSCLPVKNWCDLGNLNFQSNSTTKNTRSIFDLPP